MISPAHHRVDAALASRARRHRRLLPRRESCVPKAALQSGQHTLEQGTALASRPHSEHQLLALKVVDLRQMLRDRQLPVSGKKAELVSRILANSGEQAGDGTKAYEAVIERSKSDQDSASGADTSEGSPETMSLRFVDLRQIDQDARVQAIQSNLKLMAMWFLGTCSAATPSSAHGPSLSLRAGNDIWFFDCADDTQRQLQRVSTGGPETGIKYLKASRVFLTAFDGARLFGLPGLLCQLSMVKGESDTQVSVPVHVYGPEGVADFLDVVLATSDTCLFVPVIVFEFVPGPVEDGFSEMECLNQRSRLYRVKLPADDYNPDGYTDVSAQNKQWYPRKDVRGRTRSERLAGGRGSKVDDRGYWRQPSLPEAGDPDHPQRPVEELKWTLLCDSYWKVEVTAADFTQLDVAEPACKIPGPDDPPYHTPQPGINVASTSYDDAVSCRDPEPDIALAYTVIEPHRSGSLVKEAADALGVRPGKHFHELKSGMSIVNPAGLTVHPEQVCAPDQAGRTLLITGQRVNAPALIRNSPSVDIVLADIVTGETTGLEAAGLCTEEAAVTLARDTGAAAIVVWARCEAREGRLRPCSKESEDKLRQGLKERLRDDVVVAVPDMLEIAAVSKQ